MSNKPIVEKEALVWEVKAILEKEYGREFTLEESQKVFNTIDQFAAIVVEKWFRNKGKITKSQEITYL
jgi:hypothetical protein